MLGNEWAESMKSLGQAYRAIYEKDERTPQQKQAAENEYDAYEADPATGGGMDMTFDEWKKQRKKPKKEGVDYSMEMIDEYSVSVEDGMALEEGKKKCKEGYKYDSDKKKCVKKKKKSSSSKTTVVVKTGYGGGYWGGHGHGGSNGGSDGGDGETESNGGGDGGDGGGGE